MADTTVSPLAPKEGFPDMPVVDGVRFATAAVGVRYQGRDDVMLALLDPGTTIAGVFTKSATRAAPVLDCQAKLGSGSEAGAAILVNSGNANAFTGRAGDQSVEAICSAVSDAAGIPASRVFTSSTGVIGERLPDERIRNAVAGLVESAGAASMQDAAGAIMTTDTYAKGSVRVLETPNGRVTITGIAKGSGMIAPDMATMLAYVFTDAKIAHDKLQEMVTEAVDHTFNRITVDSDTSTSDTVLVAATGASGVDVTDDLTFESMLEIVMQDLAHQVVRDGEGATKFVEIIVTGAADEADAQKAAMAIANSPLVKTAIAGEDPNWGRIVMAVGKSGAQADRDKLKIEFGPILVAENGWVAESYREEDGASYMKNDEITILVNLGVGASDGVAWTCDLTHGYITINADYRS
ncbi:MAG: bifunctional glutamate N-acetyltransferase/amino-acid acetyltransferase ArgJ [Boseongicola sp.]|nr:bifunctional glutamate N-acetyltransferase/amino-acid acetyltransferase ArgJ [Boseongicola sp.]MDD9976940.1 bifunctional glutamate N-acetyltransferase/amino-acid acetyltransferase ArgJ [Boseongicola sp.]